MYPTAKTIHHILTLGKAAACALLFSACSPAEKPQIDLIPTPLSMEVKGGFFKADSSLLKNDFTDDRITLSIDTNLNLKPEGYILSVGSRSIQLTGASEKGLFYGKQTLRQLFSESGIPCVKISDEPRFDYRGFHLDVSRHFFTKEEVFKILDEVAFYKFNTFHFHFVDNGGWRLEMDSYPKLTQVGAYRTIEPWSKWYWPYINGKFVSKETPNAYGGYYTKAEMREIIDYATQLHLTVIPEIEFPAHSDEVFAAYPELCCMGKSYSGGEFCVANPEVYTFMEKILTEIIELFPSQYIHIGGDEARRKEWEKCPKCQALMRQEGMKDEEGLQCYMIRKIDQFLQSKGKKLIGWDEILKTDLSEGAISMAYRGEVGILNGPKQKRPTIMTPGAILYMDWYQAEPTRSKRAMDGYSPIKKMYSYEPVPTDSATAAYNESILTGKRQPALYGWLSAEEAKYVVGVQGCAWTEFIDTPEHLEFMVFPRVLAIAETAWSAKENKNWQDFKPRMNRHIAKLRDRGINAYTLSWEVEITSKVQENGAIEVTLDAERYPAEIHYTTDGSIPTATSARYEVPFLVQDSATIKAGIFVNDTLQDIASETFVDNKADVENFFEYNPQWD